MKRTALAAIKLFLFAGLAGCGGGSEGSVQGTVSFDGQPVANGAVTFVKSEGGMVREGAVIQSGRFQARMPPGKYKIEVNAKKVVGKRKQKGFGGEVEEVEVTAELFPERFNTKTELSEDIKPGTNTVNLDLKSKK